MTATNTKNLTFKKPSRSFKYRFFEWQRLILEILNIDAVEIDENSLLTRAQEITGLDDFGDARFREPLNILIESLNSEANLNATGRYLLRAYLLGLLTNRLKVQQELKTHPEIRQVSIEKPLFVLGLPRSGTTFLFNLLSQDPGSRWLHYWELLMPSPPPAVETAATDPRIEQIEERIKFLKSLAPDIDTAHYLNPVGPEECNALFEHDFVSAIFFFRANVPTYHEWLIRQPEILSSYKYYYEQLQLLSWKWPGEHWLLKAPVHLRHLQDLLTVFPNANIIQNHRDPLKVMPSLCSLNALARSIYSDKVEPAQIGSQRLDILTKIVDRGLSVRRNSSSKQFFDVNYTDLIKDPIGTVRRIYDYFGYNFSQQMNENLQRYIKENRQHKHGVHRYSLEQFDLKAEEVNERFKDYCEYFQIVREFNPS